MNRIFPLKNERTVSQRERYQQVERTLVKLVEEVEGIEDGNLKE